VGSLPQSRHRGPLSALVPPKARREVFVLYSYGVRRPKPAPEPVEEPTYRELQAQAKELEIPANQSREDLEAALAEADDDE
jgi:hypothetical protein